MILHQIAHPTTPRQKICLVPVCPTPSIQFITHANAFQKTNPEKHQNRISKSQNSTTFPISPCHCPVSTREPSKSPLISQSPSSWATSPLLSCCPAAPHTPSSPSPAPPSCSCPRRRPPKRRSVVFSPDQPAQPRPVVAGRQRRRCGRLRRLRSLLRGRLREVGPT